MSQLFELVRDHVEGFDTIAQEWQSADGIKTVNITLARPAAWIERVHERGVLTALDCLAIIFFALDDWSVKPSRDQEVSLVEGWAAELRKAVDTGEIQARDPFTLLPLSSVPEGLGWGLLMSDADKFVAARGMAWRFGEIASHICGEVSSDIDAKRFPVEFRSIETAQGKKAAPAQPQAAAPAPVVAESAEVCEEWKDKARQRAREIIARQKAKDLHPSQENIADEICPRVSRRWSNGSRRQAANGCVHQAPRPQGHIERTKQTAININTPGQIGQENPGLAMPCEPQHSCGLQRDIAVLRASDAPKKVCTIPGLCCWVESANRCKQPHTAQIPAALNLSPNSSPRWNKKHAPQWAPPPLPTT